MLYSDLYAAVVARYGVPFAQRFVARITVPPVRQQETACWLWTGGLAGATDRPCAWLQGKSVYVARLVLRLKLDRAIRSRRVAAHTCDNPRCVNPNHLHEATHSRNLREAWQRGRRTPQPCTFINEDYDV